MKRVIHKVCLFLAAAVILCSAAHAAPDVSTRCGILVDAATGRVLWQQRADEKSLIASTTKIMTGLLIAENCDMNDCVAVTPEATVVEGSSIGLKADEVVTVRELFYGMLLQSGNDAATALAIYCGGSLGGFTEMMNRRAEDLGLRNTSFANPHGLDDIANYSTAEDLAVLSRAAMSNSVFATAVGTASATVGGRQFVNHNKLLRRYDGATGIKTGYTKAAGRILVSSARQNGRELICVTINAPDDWNDHKKLLNYGFHGFSTRTIFSAGEVLGELPVICGAEEHVQFVLQEDVTLCVRKGETISYRLDVPIFVFAPVLSGDQMGRVVVMIDEQEVAEAPLYWRHSVLEGV